jgi:hypothetical protein
MVAFIALKHFFGRSMMRNATQVGVNAPVNPAARTLEPVSDRDLKIRQAIEREVRCLKRELQCRLVRLRIEMLLSKFRRVRQRIEILAFDIRFAATEIGRDLGRRLKNLRFYIRVHGRGLARLFRSPVM